MKPLTFLCTAILCVALLPLEAVDAETLFFDDFESGLDKWPDLPTLELDKDPDAPANQVLAFDTTNDNTNVDALFMEGFEDLTSYTMRARFNIVGETANFAAFGLIVRAQTATQYMLVEPANKRQAVTGILNIFERGGAWPIVADGKVDLDMNTWYELSVTVDGDTLTAFIDGKEIAEYAKVAYPKGGFGIREWASKSLIDDVEVYDADGSSLSVKPRGKLANAWGRVKTGR